VPLPFPSSTNIEPSVRIPAQPSLAPSAPFVSCAAALPPCFLAYRAATAAQQEPTPGHSGCRRRTWCRAGPRGSHAATSAILPPAQLHRRHRSSMQDGTRDPAARGSAGAAQDQTCLRRRPAGSAAPHRPTPGAQAPLTGPSSATSATPGMPTPSLRLMLR
jgi:hypothetical protein